MNDRKGAAVHSEYRCVFFLSHEVFFVEPWLEICMMEIQEFSTSNFKSGLQNGKCCSET